MSTSAIDEADEATTEGQEASQPIAVDLHNQRRLDPIAHAWRACNPRAPLPRALRLGNVAASYSERQLAQI